MTNDPSTVAALPYTLTLVTGADERYARSLMQLLLSIERVYAPAEAGTLVWDLGLAEGTRALLARRFAWAQLRTFDFAAAPEHLRIGDRAHNTNGWKPLALRAAAERCTGVLFWLDSATVLCASLDDARAQAQRTGLYTPYGGRSTIAELTHPTTLARMNATEQDRALRQRASGVVGLSLQARIARELLDAWCEAALDADVLCPEGASLANHRFDQSAWNLLLARAVRERGLELTDDEIDVSSARPAPAYRTRNKVHRDLPLATDPLLRAWFATRRAVDVSLWQLKLASRTSQAKSSG